MYVMAFANQRNWQLPSNTYGEPAWLTVAAGAQAARLRRNPAAIIQLAND